MFKRDELVLAMYYRSTKDADTGDKLALVTVKVKEAANQSNVVQSSELICRTSTGNKKAYQVGAQSISSGSDPLLSAIENYWRSNTETLAKELITESLEFFMENVSPENTWMSADGLEIFAAAELGSHLPDSVLNADSAASA
ncbi:hypothetical protein [Klebsiella oxytoca]|uniref:Uncharacterized protein n=1 Tax=Siphoviridae sp. cteRK31 TaxID=2826405 RepID=A0A8S5MKR1_9CAUD|nr:MAG TPA: hypothetical protein [Siphoviridae sp. cteRK31]HDS4380672.1 hypothetical protein [Klebsiella aerogenes]